MKTTNIESKLQKMVMERYYELKYSTKAEFIHSFDNLITGESKVLVRFYLRSMVRQKLNILSLFHYGYERQFPTGVSNINRCLL